MQSLYTMLDFLLVVLGFGFIIFIHELGHFLAARWAGIRVLAFAIGFGPPLLTYRKGMGFRRGSSEREYFDRTARGVGAVISPTEYRLNALPFGGYVKMLGQEDMDPSAVSSASDSYQTCKVWKRMVVISAGVAMNIVSAMLIFMVVFLIGLKVEPAKVGIVYPGSAAAKAVITNASGQLGLRPGDEILKVDGDEVSSFNQLATAAAMSGPHDTVHLVVHRDGEPKPLDIIVTPETSRLSGLRELGIEPYRTCELPDVKADSERKEWDETMARLGVTGLPPGMTLTSVQGKPVDTLQALVAAIDTSDGSPVAVGFSGTGGQKFETTLTPRAQLRIDVLSKPAGETTVPVDHLLGLTPVMTVAKVQPAAAKQGLKDGDIIARVADVEYPSLWQGLPAIRSHAGETIEMVVLRKNAAGELEEVTLKSVKVDSKGTIGFNAGDVGDNSTLVAMPPAKLQSLTPPRDTGEPYAPAATRLITSPGTEIVGVDGHVVKSLAQVRRALRVATQRDFDLWSKQLHPSGSVNVAVELRQPVHGSVLTERPTESKTWTLTAEDVMDLHALGWDSPLPLSIFEPAQVLQKGKNPIDAMSIGLQRTREVMLTTYLTFARLAQGTVKVEHLKGPVGIAHLGTMVASRGPVWLLFFMGLISINLAVINFLPLPIVDGGQFLFLLFEQVRGKPVPIAVQSAATLVGLVLLGCVFLLVTFNDVKSLLGL
ncbi:MAG: site-2 protease family protein [Phycisphaerales bacterium]|jgi:regulator of sigma E protease